MRVFPYNLPRVLLALALLAAGWLSSVTAQTSGWPPSASNLWQWSLASPDAPTQATVVIQDIAPLATGEFTIYQVPPGRALVVTDAVLEFSASSAFGMSDIGLIEVHATGTERLLDRRGWGIGGGGPTFGWKAHAPLGRVVAPGSSLVLRVRNWSASAAISHVTCAWPTRLTGYFASPASASVKQPSWPPTFDRIVGINRGDSTLPPFGLPLAADLASGASVDHDLLIVQGPAQSKLVLTDFQLRPGCGAPGDPCWDLHLRIVLYERKSGGEEVVLAVLTGVNSGNAMSMQSAGPVGPSLDQGSTLAMRVTNAGIADLPEVVAWDISVGGYYATEG